MNELYVRDTVEIRTCGLLWDAIAILSLKDRGNLRKLSFRIALISTKIRTGYFRMQVWVVTSRAYFSACVSCSATLSIVQPTYRRALIWRLLCGLFAPLFHAAYVHWFCANYEQHRNCILYLFASVLSYQPFVSSLPAGYVSPRLQISDANLFRVLASVSGYRVVLLSTTHIHICV
jgi:hypothetical protein